MAIDVQSFPLIKEPRERVELVWSAGDAGVDGDMKQKHVLGDDGAFVLPLQAASSHGRVQQEQQRAQQKICRVKAAQTAKAPGAVVSRA